ncbi:MAG: TerD family protein [Deltaproteobacteria bacterium]|nr:TerD family protein [Deltaproteobacteria bacterium]
MAALDPIALSERGAKQHMMVSELTVTLSWRAQVDLDLMAFYRTKSGDVGAVHSPLYSSKSAAGALDAFPFMQLGEDAGVVARKRGDGSEKRETLKIKRLDDIAELYLVAMNFTDAARNHASAFVEFDGQVQIEARDGQRVTVVLASKEQGAAAVFARIEHSNALIGPVLHNESRVLTLDALRAQLPGAKDLSLASKLLLQSKGDSAPLLDASGVVRATLRWRASVDLDLHCFYTLKPERPSGGGGFFSKLFGGGEPAPAAPGESGHVYFRQRGALAEAPFVFLDKDSGIGDRGGDNEENIAFGKVERLEQAIIVANIFNKPNASFGSYDGSVILRAGGQEIEVPLTERAPGAWCIIAQIDNRGAVPTIVNINQTQTTRPELPLS